MPRTISKLRARRGRLAVFSVLPLIVLALILPGVGSAVTLNSSQLDYGYCGQNLQLGSDKTASNSSTPSFVLAGDGSAASYQISIDGTSIGTFASDAFGNVCIRTTTALADGAHVLTGSELRPNTANGVPAFNFSVDTAAPPAPSAPALTFTNDTGVKGDNITRLRTFTITGTSPTNAGITGINAYWASGSRYFGGASPSNGTWTIVGTVPSDGAYALQSSSTDEASNVSPNSSAVTITVDSAPPTSSLTSPASGAVVSGTVNVAASASDTGSGVSSVAFQVDSVTKQTNTAAPYTYAWNTTGVTNGQHTLTETTTDVAGNTSTSSVTVDVENGTGATAPGAPTLSSATAGNATVALAWSAPASNGGSAVTGYKIYRGTTSGGETLLTTLGNVTSWTDTGLSNGTTYYYKVSAVNAVGEGAASGELSAMPVTTPGAPTLMSAVPGNSVTLTWSAPANTGGAAITGYRVYRGTASGGETLLATVGNVTTYTDETTTYGTTYYFQVSAVTAAGEGARSNEMSATPMVAPSAPTLASASGGNGSVALAWSAPSSNGGSAVTGYRVYRGTTSGGETLLTTLGNVTSWTDSNAANGTTYYYKVSALNSVGEGVASNELSATPSAPLTAPSAPTLNSATAGNGSVALAWSAPSSNGGAAVTGYKVYRGTTSGGETLLTTLGNVTSWTDSNAANGTTYYYKVSALNSVGEGVASNERSATPSAPATAPSAPALNSATAGNASVALAWSAPSSNGGSAVTGYKVYRGTTSAGETLLTTLGNVTSWTDSGATNGTKYYYEVSALNAVGESLVSNELSATPLTVPGAPALNSATAGNGSVALGWSAPSSNGGSAVTGYRVYRGTTSGGETLLTTLGNVTSWTDTGPTNGTTYYYKVTALNASGESAGSNELSATPSAPLSVPSAPTLNSASPGNGSVALGWSAPASNGGSAVTGYKVYRGTTSGGETLLTTLGNVTSWTDTGAANGTAYYYRVSAVNSVGEGGSSNELSATPATTAGAPTLNSATPGNAAVALAWSAPGSNGGSAVTGYKIYRGTSSGGETLLTTLGNVTSWTDGGTSNGTTYYYKLTALNAVGESAGSNELSAMPATAPGAPTLNSATAGNGSVALAWSAPSSNGGSAVTAYRIYRGTSTGGETFLTTVGTVTSWTDTAVSNGTTYYYRVSAMNSVGESVASNERSATPAAASTPGAPSLTGLSANRHGFALTWAAPASNGGSAITGYRIYRGTASGQETLLTTVGNVTSWTDTSASSGTYFYEVSAVNAVGESARSNELSTTSTRKGHH